MVQTSANFWPSAAKAILIQTAADYGNPNVDYLWGYGQVNVQAALDLITRQAFRQETISAGEADLYSLLVSNSSEPIKVSLAWDDYEATFNASVALINNLDLELVSPSGAIYRSWVLNPASPSAPAVRGLDNRNNQEQVTVANPEIGAWRVRVRRTIQPYSPQGYSLACEGCRAIYVGVCQSDLAGDQPEMADYQLFSSSSRPEQELVVNTEGDEWLPEPGVSITVGERWQRGLEGAAWLSGQLLAAMVV